jgi:choline-glycine betaine transporter
MSDPDRLTSHDDMARGRDTRGLILRIIVVAFLAALFWHTVIAAGML